MLSVRTSRRSLLLGGGALSALAIAQMGPRRLLAQPKFAANPFTLGVASGEPRPTSVVLWTKLLPDPFAVNSGLTGDIPVQWQIATDERLENVVAAGTVMARPEWGHGVHVLAEKLAPQRWYWYRFKSGGALSPVGRTRTAPAPDASHPSLRFAFASCQNYEHGYFTAYRAMAAEDLDFVVHLGDYIYEGKSQGRPDSPRKHPEVEAQDLASYRQRYALYKLDPDLQEAHRLFPFICTWDDHEVDNDYANLESQDFDDPALFQRRRAAAYQAYYEHLPLSPLAPPVGPNLQLYRHLPLGQLAGLWILDGRQYRDDQACDDNGRGGGQPLVNCDERLDPQRSLLGFPQEQWLQASLREHQARWNILAQPYLVADLQQQWEGQPAYWSDGWDGYGASRERLLSFLGEERIPNPVFIGGDIHSFWVSELRPQQRNPQSPVVACEFVGTSISSNGIPRERIVPILPDNPHIQFFESRLRGYVRCSLTQDQWVSDLRVVDTVKERGGKIRTLASFAVEAGQPQVRRLF